jgi:hypothetical protein
MNPSRRAWRFDRRLALGLSPTPVPWLLLLVGVALGPHGLRVLSPPVLRYFDPAVSVALAALGVLVGLGLDFRRSREARLLAAASLEAGITLLLVGGGLLVLLSLQTARTGLAPWLLALLLGICAAASATATSDPAGQAPAPASHIGDLDDVLPIVIGGLALAWIREGSLEAAVWLMLPAGVVAGVIALAALLLVRESSADNEQRVFAVGSLLLLGGVAESLALSALLAGLVAGVFWNVAGGAVCERIRRDVYYVQHPAVALLLIVAGAHVSVTPILYGFAAAYVVLRITGKIAGGWLVRRVMAADLPPQLGLSLMSPGVVGVAFALNVLQAGGPDRAAPALAVVVAGSIGSELLSFLLRPRARPA